MSKPTYEELEKSVKELEKAEAERKKEMETLQNIKKRFKDLAELLPEFVIETDKKGKITFANKAVYDNSGYSKEDFKKGIKTFQLIIPEEHEKHKKIFNKRKRIEEVGIKEYMFLRKDGSKFPIIVHSNIITDDNGNVLGTRAIGINITERKKAEEALRKSEEKYRTMFNINPDVQYQLNMNGKITIINKRVKSLLGYEPEELIGKKFSKLVFPEDQVKYGAGVERRTGKRATRGIELRVVGREGKITDAELRWTEISAAGVYENGYVGNGRKSSRGQATRYIGTQGTIRDITDRKKAEELLKESEEFNKALFEYNPIETIVVDIEGRITVFNQAKKISGNRLPNIGDVMYRDYAGKHEIDMYAEMMECIKSDKIKTFPEQKYVDRFIAIKISPFSHGAIITTQDITERKKAEETLKESEEKYRSLFEKMINGYAYCKMIFDKDNKPIDWIYIDVNDSFERITGLKKDVIGKKVTEAIPGIKEDVPELFEFYGKVVLTGEEASFEIYLDTLKIWFSIMAFCPQKGFFVSVFEDITKQKIAEEALKEKIVELNSFINNIPDMAWLMDIENRFIAANTAYGKAVGKDPGTLVNKGYEVCFGKKGGKKLREEDMKVIKSRKQIIFEEEINIDNNTIWLETIKSPIFDNSEKVIGTVGIARNITHRKQAEEALRENEERYKRITDEVTDYIFTVRIEDGQPVETTHNPASIAVTGYIPEEFAAEPDLWIRIVHEDDRAAVIEQASHILTGKSVEPLEHRIICQSGKTCWVRNTPVPYYDAQGKLLSYDGLISDITERKKAEEDLKNSESTLRSIFNNSPLMIGIVEIHDKDILHLLDNESSSKFFGIPLEKMNNQYSSSFGTPQEHIDFWIKHYRECERTGKPVSFTYTHNTLSGPRILSTTVCFITKIDNNSRFSYVVEDITDRKQLEEARIKTEKLESIGILAGGIAHDFNNILTVILGNISLAKMRIDSKSEEYEVLKEAENASYRAKDLTQQLLTFAKGGAPIKETTELTGLIKETTQFSLRGSNVQYCTSFTPDLWIADVDKGQINQTLNNLIINARHAMPDGGTINIAAENVSITPEDNLPLQKGNYIKISIKDKGIGITKDHLSKIFDPYFTTKQMGSGLGLATTYSIIHRHNGHIAVESELGVGTTFHIYLPASSKEVEKKEAVNEDTVVLTGKILVMDDEPEIRKIVNETLTLGGLEVEVASDGDKAIKLYKKAMDSGKPFDAVILDLTIPGGMGGKKAIQKLLEIDPDAKAVVSSGYADDPAISNFEAYGFSGFIYKPYKLEELKRVLKKVILGKKE